MHFIFAFVTVIIRKVASFKIEAVCLVMLEGLASRKL
jgi:hypothetical protein